MRNRYFGATIVNFVKLTCGGPLVMWTSLNKHGYHLQTFQMHFVEINCLYFYQNIIDSFVYKPGVL